MDGLIMLQELADKSGCSIEDLLQEEFTSGEYIEWKKRLEWAETDDDRRVVASAILELLKEKLEAKG
jgi:hypothetical protein